MSFVFVCWHITTNKYQKYKSVEFGYQQHHLQNLVILLVVAQQGWGSRGVYEVYGWYLEKVKVAKSGVFFLHCGGGLPQLVTSHYLC